VKLKYGQLDEDGVSSTRQSWIQTSRLWDGLYVTLEVTSHCQLAIFSTLVFNDHFSILVILIYSFFKPYMYISS